MLNGIYKPIALSIFAHILLMAILSTMQKPSALIKHSPQEKQAIKSYLYKRPALDKVAAKTVTESPKDTMNNIEVNPQNVPAKNTITDVKEPKPSEKKAQPTPPVAQPQTLATPTKDKANKPVSTSAIAKKLPKDSFSQLQQLRSKLNRNATLPSNHQYQTYQQPSIFNRKNKVVPKSIPLLDPEKERDNNTQNLGAGIAIEKSDNGTCAITQDMSAYGLDNGSSTQYFNCGESKFDKSFRLHMKNVQKKIKKN